MADDLNGEQALLASPKGVRPLLAGPAPLRTHGGAYSVEFVVGTDDPPLNRTTRNVEAMATIAGKARGLVHPDSTVFLDSRSTTTALARELGDERLIVFTNSLTCAAELARLERARCIMVGGNLNRYSMSLNDSKTIKDVSALSFDLLILGVTSCQSRTGFHGLQQGGAAQHLPHLRPFRRGRGGLG